MTYDLMNRRDNVTKHHSGVKNSLEAIDAYVGRGLSSEKANLGLGFYVKWFKTAPGVSCAQNPIGCKAALMEDPETGGDLGRAGAFSWHDTVPSELASSFKQALSNGVYDETEGGHYFWDESEEIWWSWDTPEAITKKFPRIIEKRRLGGLFAWGLGEDAEKWEHLRAATDGLRKLKDGQVRERDEL